MANFPPGPEELYSPSELDHYFLDPDGLNLVDPDLFLFTAAKKYGHKLYITKENKERLGKLLNHFLSTNQVLFGNKPSEKSGLLLIRT